MQRIFSFSEPCVCKREHIWIMSCRLSYYDYTHSSKSIGHGVITRPVIHLLRNEKQLGPEKERFFLCDTKNDGLEV